MIKIAMLDDDGNIQGKVYEIKPQKSEYRYVELSQTSLGRLYRMNYKWNYEKDEPVAINVHGPIVKQYFKVDDKSKEFWQVNGK